MNTNYGNNQAGYEPQKPDYEPSNDNFESKGNPAAIYSGQESYSGKGSNPEFRIAIIAADTGDKTVAESVIKESKLIPLSSVDSKSLKSIPMGSVTISSGK